MEFAKGQIA